MPRDHNSPHLVESRSRSRRSAYSISSEEFEEVVSGGASPLPVPRPGRETAAPLPPETAPQVVHVDVPLGYHTGSNARAVHAAKPPRESVVADNPASSSRKGFYPREVDVTASPQLLYSPSSGSSSSRSRRRGNEASSNDDVDEEVESGARGRNVQTARSSGRVAHHRDVALDGMLGVLSSARDEGPSSHDREGEPRHLPSSSPPPPVPPPDPSVLGAPQPSVEPIDAPQRQGTPSSSPATPQPVLFYTTPFLALDANYAHAPPAPPSDPAALPPSSSSSSRTLPDASWAVTACGGAVANQCCVCLMSSVLSCVALPCLVAKERERLLFHDIEGRYVCCAGIIPCCIPDRAVRPELYVTIAPPQPRALQGKYGIYPQQSMPVSQLGEAAVENITDKVNGLPQFGCYRKARTDTARRPTAGRSGRSYEGADMDLAQIHGSAAGGSGRVPVSCCCGCCVVDTATNVCLLDCDRGGCVRCRHPTSCCVSCPHGCLACEVCCCFPCAVLGNRMLLRQHYGLQPDACVDTPAICCYACLRTCLLCASPPAPGSGRNRLIGCCGAPDPNTCCAECGYSLATCLAACCCFFPCVSCAMAQHRDQVERVGFPVLSAFSPPDITGMS